MKFEISKSELAKALNVGGSLAGSGKTTIAILSNAKFDVTENSLKVTSSNIETEVASEVQVVSSDGAFSFCVEPKPLTELLSSIQDEAVEIELVDSTALVVRYFGGEMQIPYQKADEFPLSAAIDGAVQVELNAYTIMTELNAALRFAGRDELRKILNSVCVKIGGGKMDICSSDTHVLYLSEHQCEYMGDEITSIVPLSAVAVIVKALAKSVTVTMYVAQNAVKVVSEDGNTIQCTLLQGRFPNYNSVIPKYYNTEVVVGVKPLATALKRAMIGSNVSALVKMSYDNQFATELRVSAEDFDFAKKSSTKVSCEGNGNDFTIGFNGAKMQNVLAAMADDVAVRIIDAIQPIIIKPKGYENVTALLMPMSIE